MEVNYAEETPQEPVSQEQIPQEPVDIQSGSNQVVYAGFLLRFVAAIIDAILFVSLSTILVLFININFFQDFRYGLNIEKIMQYAFSLWIISIFLLIVHWLYYALMESSSKQGTLGKIIVGIKVTDLNGQRINFMKASIRYFPVRFIIPLVFSLIGLQFFGFLFILIANLMIIFTEKKQALQDIIAGCLVVKG